MIAQIFVRAEDADQLVDLVVVRFDVVVRDGPVVAQAVEALAAKIVGAEAQRDASPVIRPAAEHACAPPRELCAWRAGVRLALDLPAAVARVEFAEWTSFDGCAAMRRRPVRHEHL